MVTRAGLCVAAATLTLAVAACGGGTAPEPAADESAATGTGASRVFFITPTDGATIAGEARLEFGSELVTIAAIPQGELTEADVRPGIAHYHIAVDTECLPAGVVIPQADPWVHFGSGASTAEVSLTPGPHTLTLQAGDDMHRTIEGLCQTISVTVE